MRELGIGVGLAVLLVTSSLAAYHPNEIGSPNPAAKQQSVAAPSTVAAPILHHRPKHIKGVLNVGKLKMDFGSGGHGWSIPLGSYPITPDEVGSWGKRHHAIGINSNEIPDKELGRTREGIEIHAADDLTSAGCVVVSPSNFRKLKDLIGAIIAEAGHAYLHVGPDSAAITATDVSPLAGFVYAPEALASSDEKVERGVHPHGRHKYAHHHKNGHHLAMRHRHHLAVK